MAEVSINSEIMETVIGEKTQFKGSVNTDKAIKIAGKFDGTIESTGLVVVDKTGSFTGTLKCKELDLIGEVDANVECSYLFKFADSGKFKGDAKVANIDMHPGVDFDGTLKIVK